MNISCGPNGLILPSGRRIRCAYGKGGFTLNKTEGDGATPVGTFPLRFVLYRPDRVYGLQTRLSAQAINEKDGWCDDPKNLSYNQKIRKPFEARHEDLWRDDYVYDIIVILGYNDSPVVKGRGSAVFFHLAHDDFRPTQGCIAILRSDMEEVLRVCTPQTSLTIHEEGPF